MGKIDREREDRKREGPRGRESEGAMERARKGQPNL